MDKINVCHILTLTRWGGVESRLVEYLAHRKDARLQHFVIATSAIEEIAQAVRKVNVPIFIPSRRWHYDPTAIWQMAKWLRSHHIHVVHTRNRVANCWGGLSSIISGIPVRIAGEHGSGWLNNDFLAMVEGVMYRSSKLVVANSIASKIIVVTNRKVDSTRIRVVYNAIALDVQHAFDLSELYDEFNISPDDLIVGTIGRLSISKDYFSWLDAAKLLAEMRNDVKFIIVGGGPLERELKHYARSLNIDQQVIFAGWRDDARRILELFDIYVSTSIHESFGNTLVEAALCKKPVIAPQIDGIPEVVVDGKTGVLLYPKENVKIPECLMDNFFVPKVVINDSVVNVMSVSAKELAEQMDHLLATPKLRKSLGEAGYHRAVELFSIERYVEELESIYVSSYLENANI